MIYNNGIIIRSTSKYNHQFHRNYSVPMSCKLCKESMSTSRRWIGCWRVWCDAFGDISSLRRISKIDKLLLMSTRFKRMAILISRHPSDGITASTAQPLLTSYSERNSQNPNQNIHSSSDFSYDDTITSTERWWGVAQNYLSTTFLRSTGTVCHTLRKENKQKKSKKQKTELRQKKIRTYSMGNSAAHHTFWVIHFELAEAIIITADIKFEWQNCI